MYKPSTPFSSPLKVIPAKFTTAYGVPTKNAADPKDKDAFDIFGSWKTYGGIERNDNGLYSIEDTADVETWYRPDITSSCRILNVQTGALYEIMGEPEDIEQRHIWLVFKVRRVKGNA